MPKLETYARLTEIPGRPKQLIQHAEIEMMDQIDQQIDQINFEHVALLMKSSQFNLSWVKKIKQSLKEPFNIAFKQFLINKLELMNDKPANKEIKGYISYFRVSWFLRSLNFDTLKLETHEIEFTLFQFVYLKIQEEVKRQEERDQQSDPESATLKKEGEISGEENTKKDKDNFAVKEFMRRMKGRISTIQVLNVDLAKEDITG